MGKYFTKYDFGLYKCNRCGKVVREGGQPAHIGWHKKQEGKSQVLLAEPTPYVKHKPYCKCTDCVMRREITGQ